MRRIVVSSIVLTLFFVGMIAMAFHVQSARASGTKHMRAERSMDPSATPAQSYHSMGTVPPPVEWNQTYGGFDFDEAYDVQQTSDGGYIACGYARSFDVSGYGYADGWLVKTDADGSLQWNKTYCRPWDDVFFCIQKTSDGGYIACGFTCMRAQWPGDNWSSDFWLVKTDANGNEQWNKTHGSELGDEKALEIRQTSDGGYIVVGWTDYIGLGAGYNIWLVKTNAIGNYEWDRVYGGDGDEHGYHVERTSDGGYIIAGNIDYEDSDNIDGVLVKVDSNATLQWSKTYDWAMWDWFNSVRQTNDGGYIVAGGAGDGCLVKTDAEGNTQWNKTYGTILEYEDVFSVEQTSDGGYVAVGYAPTYMGYEDCCLFKTDSSGTILWEKILHGEYTDLGYSFAQTSDGGFIVAGVCQRDSSSLYDGWLVKLGPPPPATHDVSITNVVLSRSIVGQGFSLNINVTAANQGDYSESFNVTANVNTTAIGEIQVSLNTAEEMTVTFTCNTTGFPKGNYTISAYAWQVPGETDTTDNTFTGGYAIVAMVGDVAGEGTFPSTLPDGKVDIKDLATLAKCYGAVYPSPNYYANYDLNEDGKIDIKDLATAAKNYGKNDP